MITGASELRANPSPPADNQVVDESDKDGRSARRQIRGRLGGRRRTVEADLKPYYRREERSKGLKTCSNRASEKQMSTLSSLVM